MPYMPTCPGCGGYWLIRDALRAPGTVCSDCERKAQGAPRPEQPTDPDLRAEAVTLRPPAPERRCGNCRHWGRIVFQIGPLRECDGVNGYTDPSHAYDDATDADGPETAIVYTGSGDPIAPMLMTAEDFSCALWAPRGS